MTQQPEGGERRGQTRVGENPVSSSVCARINGERLVVLGWPRAILMQLAHPLVAAGVCRHSSVRDSAAAPIYRLHATISAMLGIGFGRDDERRAVIAHIRQIHTRVRGHLDEDIGPFARGTVYSAEDPALLLWVHATLVDTSLLFYERLVGPLDDSERDEYCRVSAGVAIALGANAPDVPSDWRRLREYTRRMFTSPALAVGPDARLISSTLMEAKALRVAWPLSSVVRRLTIGTLPAALRDQYGFPWSRADEAAFPAMTGRLQRLRGLTPGVVARFAAARRAAP